MKNRLFVFGCSYAVGDELLLHELGEADEFRLATADDPRKFFKFLESRNLQDEYNKIKEKQKALAWPQLLANKLKYECINLAESGNSLDKILFQLFNNQYQIKDTDIAIVSLTKPTRNAIFDNSVESFQLPSLYWPVQSLIGVKDTGDMKPVISKETDQALLHWFTNNRVAWDFVKNLKVLETTGVYIIPTITVEIETTMPIIKEMYNSSKQKFLTDKSLDDFCTVYHGWGHPDATAHQKYAEHLYEILR